MFVWVKYLIDRIEKVITLWILNIKGFVLAEDTSHLLNFSWIIDPVPYWKNTFLFIKVYDFYVSPVATYGLETVTLTQKAQICLEKHEGRWSADE